MPAGTEHLGEGLAFALFDQVAIEQLAEAEDRVEWRAQLMADAREEARLGHVQALGLELSEPRLPPGRLGQAVGPEQRHHREQEQRRRQVGDDRRALGPRRRAARRRPRAVDACGGVSAHGAHQRPYLPGDSITGTRPDDLDRLGELTALVQVDAPHQVAQASFEQRHQPRIVGGQRRIAAALGLDPPQSHRRLLDGLLGGGQVAPVPGQEVATLAGLGIERVLHDRAHVGLVAQPGADLRPCGVGAVVADHLQHDGADVDDHHDRRDQQQGTDEVAPAAMLAHRALMHREAPARGSARRAGAARAPRRGGRAHRRA